MIFLNPLILAGLLLAALPILILLLINRKKLVLNWAAYEWMKKAQVKRKQQTKLNEILKLIAKTLLMLLLVLLMARPAISSSDGGRKLLVIDNTLSMATALGGGTRLDKAKELAAKFLAESDSSVALCSFDETLTPLSKMQQFSSSSNRLLDTIVQSPKASSFSEFIGALYSSSMFKEANAVYFISDFQASQFQDGKMLKEAVQRLGDKKLVFVPVDTRSGIENVGIILAEMIPEGFYPGRNNEILVKVKNYSSAPAPAVPVTLSVNGAKKERAMLSLPPGGESEILMGLNVPEGEESKVTLELPADAYAPDNKFNLVVSQKGGLNVLVICKEKGDAAFESDIFLKRGLSAFLGGNFLKYKSVRPQQILNEDTDNYDVIIMLGVPLAGKNGITDTIISFLRKSNKALISFSDLSMPDFWQALGVESSATVENSAMPELERLSGSYLDFMKTGDLNPASVSFMKYCGIKANAEIQARLCVKGLNEPVMAFMRRGSSKVILAGFMPSPGYTNIIYNPNFVQWLMRVMTEALNRGTFFSLTGNAIEKIPLAENDAGDTYLLSVEDGQSSRLEPRKGDGGALFLSGKPMVEDVFCTVLREKEKIMSFGYNATREESSIEPAVKANLKEGIEAGLVYDDGQDFTKTKAQREIIGLLALLLLAGIIFDHYVHFWRKK